MDRNGVWVSNFTHYFRVLDRVEAMGILLWIRSAEGISDLLRSVVISFSGLVSVSGPGSTFFDQLISQNAVTHYVSQFWTQNGFLCCFCFSAVTQTQSTALWLVCTTSNFSHFPKVSCLLVSSESHEVRKLFVSLFGEFPP